MDLTLDTNGDPLSALITELSGEAYAFPPASSGPHLFQALASRWRALSTTLTQMVDVLAGFDFAIEPDGFAALDTLKRLIYDAAELFDVYTQLFLSAIKSLVTKSDSKSYMTASKRLRDPWALICNKCKHSGSQFAFIWAKSQVNGATSARFMVCSYRDGNALVRDDDIHEGRQSGICIRRAVKELIHALLRIDLLAAKLTRTADRGGTLLPTHGGSLPIGKPLRRLQPLKTFSLNESSNMFDDFALLGGLIILKRSSSVRLIDPVNIRTQIQGDGVTQIFSFA